MPGPRPDRLPIIYPSHIALYRECPERYYRKHVLRQRAAEPFSRALARGVALHAVAAECFAEFRDGRPGVHDRGAFPVDHAERVERHLGRFAYPDDQADARMEDATAVVDQLRWLLSRFDGTATVVGVEETLGYRYAGDDDCPACLLRAKIDLVVAHLDGELEHIEFKGGRVQRDPVQEVVARIVVGAAYGEQYPDIRTTTLFVAERLAETQHLSRDACREEWAGIRRTIGAITAEATWRPNASPLCAYCPYFENGCSLMASGGAGLDWLND